jgi:hypothetical protein
MESSQSLFEELSEALVNDPKETLRVDVQGFYETPPDNYNDNQNSEELELDDIKTSKQFPRKLVFWGTLLLLTSLTMAVVGIYLLITGFGPCRTSEHDGKKVTRCKENAGKIAGGSVLLGVILISCLVLTQKYFYIRK